MSIDPLVKVLREATKRFPPVVYAWGVVGIAAAAGLAISFIGSDISAVRTWLLVFVAAVMVAIFAQGLGHKPVAKNAPGQVLVWGILLLFLGFLTASASAVMGYGPVALERFWGLEKKPETTTMRFETPLSGQVNFGCTQGATIPLQYSAPPGFLILNAQSIPVDTKSTKFISPNGSISSDKKTFTGQVYFHGKDRDWVGNCPGGGHGKAKVVGDLIRDDSVYSFPYYQVMFLVVVGLFASSVFIRLNRGRRSLMKTEI